MKSDNKHETMPAKDKFMNTDTATDHSATAVTMTQALAGPQPAGPQPAGPQPAGPQLLRSQVPVEIGGPKRLEPTRYGDWEKNGRCIDF